MDSPLGHATRTVEGLKESQLAFPLSAMTMSVLLQMQQYYHYVYKVVPVHAVAKPYFRSRLYRLNQLQRYSLSRSLK